MEKDLRELADEILTEMYAEAKPPRDFMEIRENLEQAEDGWYKNHYLSNKRQNEIYQKHIDKHDELSDSAKTSLMIEVLVSLSPSNTK